MQIISKFICFVYMDKGKNVRTLEDIERMYRDGGINSYLKLERPLDPDIMQDYECYGITDKGLAVPVKVEK